MSPSQTRPAASTPQTSAKRSPSSQQNLVPTEEDEVPRVLNSSTLSKAEKEKLRRIVTPKPGSGNLEVPENIFEMWEDASKGRDQIFKMWAKSGGVKVGFWMRKYACTGLAVMSESMHTYHAPGSCIGRVLGNRDPL